MPTMWGEKTGPRELRVYARFAADLDKLPSGERLRINAEEDRNGKFSALYHVMVSQLVKAINKGPARTTISDLKKWVKIKRGWYDLVALPQPTSDGTTHAVDYKSTSFKAMGEEEFHAFARDTCDLIRAELAPWVASSEEWQDVAQIINTILPEGAE